MGKKRNLLTIGYDFTDYDYSYLRALHEFSSATKILETIALKELTGISLTNEEKLFINSTYGENPICGGPFVEGWLSDIISKLEGAYHMADNFPNSRTSLVADIHTDTNTGDILHLATGLLEPLIAFVTGWDNEEITVVGPVFSFYEFILSSYQRLNDEEWRAILSLKIDGNNNKIYNFEMFPRGFWAKNYMVSMEMTKSRIFIDEEEFNPPKWFVGEERIRAPVFAIAFICLVVVLIIIVKKRDSIKDWKQKISR